MTSAKKRRRETIGYIGALVTLIASPLSFFDISFRTLVGPSETYQPGWYSALLWLVPATLFILSLIASRRGRLMRSKVTLAGGTAAATILTIFLFFDVTSSRLPLTPMQSKPNATLNSTGGNEALTFSSIWSPALPQLQVQDGGVTRTVRGVELEARSCPKAAMSFTLTQIPADSRVAFNLQAYDPRQVEGIYELTMNGAGVNERWLLDHDSSERVSVRTTESGNVSVALQSLHGASGQECSDTRTTLAFDRGIID